MHESRLIAWAPFLWALPAFLVDVLIRETTWLGPANSQGLKAYPAVWIASVVGLAGLLGYQAFKSGLRYRPQRALLLTAFYLVFLGGYKALGGPTWEWTSVGLFLLYVLFEITVTVTERRKERVDGLTGAGSRRTSA